MKRPFALRSLALAAAAFAAPLAWAHPGHGVTNAGAGFSDPLLALFHLLAHGIQAAGLPLVACLAALILAIGLRRVAGGPDRVTAE